MTPVVVGCFLPRQSISTLSSVVSSSKVPHAAALPGGASLLPQHSATRLLHAFARIGGGRAVLVPFPPSVQHRRARGRNRNCRYRCSGIATSLAVRHTMASGACRLSLRRVIVAHGPFRSVALCSVPSVISVLLATAFGLTFRSTGSAGTCLDLRSPSARRAGYLQR